MSKYSSALLLVLNIARFGLYVDPLHAGMVADGHLDKNGTSNLVTNESGSQVVANTQLASHAQWIRRGRDSNPG